MLNWQFYISFIILILIDLLPVSAQTDGYVLSADSMIIKSISIINYQSRLLSPLSSGYSLTSGTNSTPVISAVVPNHSAGIKLNNDLLKEINALKKNDVNNNSNIMGGLGVPLIFNRPYNGGLPLYYNK
jgi:hypothetical protein